MDGKIRRDWIKNVAIIFLVILLLLTFFSNTILNISLPEVSAQYTKYDTISTAIKASGTVKANESYVVTYDAADEENGGDSVTQTRKIVSVYVKQGSVVAIGDPILALKGGASKELEAAETELKELEKQYKLDLLQDSINDLTTGKNQTAAQEELQKARETLSDLQAHYDLLVAGKDPTELLKEQLKKAKKELETVQAQVQEIRDNITATETKISEAKQEIANETEQSLREKYAAAKQNYAVLQTEYDRLTAQAETLKQQFEEATDANTDIGKAYTISQEIKRLNETIASLQKQIAEAGGTIIGGGSTTVSTSDIAALQKAYNDAKQRQEAYLTENEAAYTAQKTKLEELTKQKSDLEQLIQNCIEMPGYEGLNLSELKKALDAVKSQLQALDTTVYDTYTALVAETEACRTRLEDAIKNTGSTGGDTGDTSQIEALVKQLQEAQASLAENQKKLQILGMPYIDDLTEFASGTNLEKLQREKTKVESELAEVTEAYNQAKETYEKLDKQLLCSDSIAEYQLLLQSYKNDLDPYVEKQETAQENVDSLTEKIANEKGETDLDKLQEQIKDAQRDVTSKEQQIKIDNATTEMTDTDKTYQRTEQKEKIEKLKKQIDTMKNAPEETIVTAPIAGKISSMDFVPGNSISSGTTVTTIEVADKGYICEVSMSNEEARRVQTGSPVSIVNGWWYSDVQASVTQIRSDPKSQGKNKIVVITITGDISEGQTLNFSIGDKSQYYDSVLPNSAIREDSEGKFVLVVESKNTPISVRYKAVRYPVEIIASDDTKSAVSGLNGGEFVITNSTSPISDKQQVRLAEN